MALLPPGTYRFANTPHDARLAALGFALGAYQFNRYRKAEARNVRLVLPEGADGEDLTRIVEAVTFLATSSTRHQTTWAPTNLKPPPANWPSNMAQPSTSPEAMLWPEKFPLINAVGMGSTRARG